MENSQQHFKLIETEIQLKLLYEEADFSTLSVKAYQKRPFSHIGWNSIEISVEHWSNFMFERWFLVMNKLN